MVGSSRRDFSSGVRIESSIFIYWVFGVGGRRRCSILPDIWCRASLLVFGVRSLASTSLRGLSGCWILLRISTFRLERYSISRVEVLGLLDRDNIKAFTLMCWRGNLSLGRDSIQVRAFSQSGSLGRDSLFIVIVISVGILACMIIGIYLVGF